MVDFDYFLTQKYANAKAQADSEANLRNVQAQTVVPDSIARNAALTSNARATMLDAQSQAPLRAAQAASTNALIQPTVNHLGAETGLLGEQTMTSSDARDINRLVLPDLLQQKTYQQMFPDKRITFGAPSTTPNTDAAKRPPPPTVTYGSAPNYNTQKSVLDIDPITGLPRYSKGTSKVPGKGSGKVDTVPSMLAPGEAVLNKGAAEHVGRDTIKHLNLIGALKMGMVGKGGKKPAGGSKGASGSKTPAKGQQAVQHHAMGTENVTPQPLISSGGGTGAGVRGMSTGIPTPTVMANGMVSSFPDQLVDFGVLPMVSQYGTPPVHENTQTPVRYAHGTSHVGKGSKTGDTPKPTDANVRMAIKALGSMGMAKKPLPKGFGKPGMV